MARKPLGIVVYEGPSVLDGAPIVVVVTGFRRSKNLKTGDMLQSWILRADVAPIEAIRAGADASVCGACPLRARVPGTLQGRDCYVRMTIPQGVWRAWRQGAYADGRVMSFQELEDHLRGRRLRMGAYGDPAAVPTVIWRYLASKVDGWTGYTHQWAHPRFDAGLLRYVMASVDAPAQVRQLPAGSRYFRVLRQSEDQLPNEVYCPADAPRTKGRVQCTTCGLCRGASAPARSIVIRAHGPATKRELTILD